MGFARTFRSALLGAAAVAMSFGVIAAKADPIPPGGVAKNFKVIGYSADALPLLSKAGVQPDEGVVTLSGTSASDFFSAAAKGRVWLREPKVRPV